ncbi:MAG: hypothetical protein JRC68_01395 [Deltaproteobacteria bacterium]|nr:hypothetical protein [Deltaproteobacteria bacterium]
MDADLAYWWVIIACRFTNKIHRFELFTNGKVGTVSLQRPDLIIERNKLIQRLADQAETDGAKLLTGRRFLNLKPNGKRLKFDLSSNGNGDSVADSAAVVVGAVHNSRPSLFFRLLWNYLRICLPIQAGYGSS